MIEQRIGVSPLFPRRICPGRGRWRLPIVCAALLAATLAGAGRLSAQTIRGTVVEDASKLPAAGVLVAMIDDAGVEVLPGVRTDSMGTFILHASRAGSWKVKAVRLGFAPVTSDAVALAVGELAVVRLRMTTVAQPLVPVLIVEDRRLNARELMSTMGFDLRQSRGHGHFLTVEQLADMHYDGLTQILETRFQPVLHVLNDPVLGEVLRMRDGGADCAPEIFLDGRLLATAPETVQFGTGPLLTAHDTVQAQAAAESEAMRAGAGQSYAMSLLSSFTAKDLHGIEVYRSTETPPPSLGAWFGLTKSSVRACGTVAVWTKNGAQSVVAGREVTAGSAVQVVSGTLVDFDTGKPLAGHQVSLLTEGRDPVGDPVVTDSSGNFTLRTKRAGELRLVAGDGDYVSSTTPTVRLSPDEMVIVKFSISTHGGVLAPLGVAARVQPQSIGIESLAGFTYRRERAMGGTFFRASDIARSGARSLAELLRGLSSITVTGAAGAEIIGTIDETHTACEPSFFLDGTRLDMNAGTVIAGLAMNRLFGVEVYTTVAEIPELYSDNTPCGVIVIWTKR
jgi:hypothetical protein